MAGFRYFIELSYNGSPFHGWQSQKNTGKTVQTVLEKVLSTALGCGRTDAGVHARQFFADFESQHSDLHTDPRKWVFKLNTMLPDAISIMAIYRVIPEASARKSAFERTYKYFIHTRPDPFLAGRSWYRYGNLNLKKMKEAAALLVGKHDFSAFSKTGGGEVSPVCDLKSLTLKKRDETIEITVTADRFLRNMVRAITGTLVEIGSGKREADEMKSILKSRARKNAGVSAPAEGLYLVSVKYPVRIFVNNGR
jgi:tRNA pseudouridine38-40 synthase